MRKEPDMGRAERAMLPAEQDGMKLASNGNDAPPSFAGLPRTGVEAPITSITDISEPRRDHGPQRTIYAIVHLQDRVRFLGTDERHVDRAVSTLVVPLLRQGVPVLKIDLTGRSRHDPTTAQLDVEGIAWSEEIANPQTMMQEHTTPYDAAEVFVSTMDTEGKEEVKLTAEAATFFSMLMDKKDIERPGDPRNARRPGAPASVGKLHDALAYITGVTNADSSELRGSLEPQLEMINEPDRAAQIFVDSLVDQASSEGKKLFDDEVNALRENANELFGYLTSNEDPDRPPDPKLQDPWNEARNTKEKPSVEKLHDAISIILDKPTVDQRGLRSSNEVETSPITFTEFQEDVLARVQEHLSDEIVTSLTQLQEHAAQLIVKGHKEDLTLTSKQIALLEHYSTLKQNESKGELWEQMRIHAAALIRGHTGEESKRHNVPPNAPADFPMPLTKRVVRSGVAEAGLNLQRNLVMRHEIAQLVAGNHPLIIEVDGSNLVDPEQWQQFAALCRSNGIGLFDTMYNPDEEAVKKLEGTLVFTRIEDANVAQQISARQADLPGIKMSTSTSGDATTISREPDKDKVLEQRQIQFIDPNRAVVLMPDGKVYHNVRLFTLPGDMDDDTGIIVTGATMAVDRLMIHAANATDNVKYATQVVRQAIVKPAQAVMGRVPHSAIGGRGEQPAMPIADKPALESGGVVPDGDLDLSEELLEALNAGEASSSEEAERPFVIQAENQPLSADEAVEEDPLFQEMIRAQQDQGDHRSSVLADFITGKPESSTDVGRRQRRGRRLLAFVDRGRAESAKETAALKEEREAILNDPRKVRQVIDIAQNDFQLETFYPLRDKLRRPDELEEQDKQLLLVYDRDDRSYTKLRHFVSQWEDARKQGLNENFGDYMERWRKVLEQRVSQFSKRRENPPETLMQEIGAVKVVCDIWQSEKPHAVMHTVEQQAVEAVRIKGIGTIPDEVPDDADERYVYFEQHIAPLEALTLTAFRKQFTPEVKAQLVFFIDKQINALIAAGTDQEAQSLGTIQGVLGPGSLRMVQLIMAAQDPYNEAIYDQTHVLAMSFKDFARDYLQYEVSESFDQHFGSF